MKTRIEIRKSMNDPVKNLDYYCDLISDLIVSEAGKGNYNLDYDLNGNEFADKIILQLVKNGYTVVELTEENIKNKTQKIRIKW